MMKKVKIDGRPLSLFRIVHNGKDGACKMAAKKLREWLDSCCGVKLEIVSNYSGENLRGCIVLGSLPTHTVSVDRYGDCKLYVQKNTVFVDAADIVGFAEGCAYLASKLALTVDENIEGQDLFYTSTLQSREEYEKNTEAFLTAYRAIHHVPAEELTLEHKKQTFNDPMGRSFVIAHRCEHTFYPENSLEAAISAWRCGADSIEVDIQKSADGVWVCMHDATLTRITNVEEFLGKPGYPNSDRLCDWSFEQLRALRLKDPYGHVTSFVIATLEEMLVACDGRMYIHLDKRFSYVNDIFPLMEKLGIYESVYLVNNIKFDEMLRLKDVFADRGIRLQNMVRTWNVEATREFAAKLLEHASSMTPAIIPVGDYVKYTDELWEVVRPYANKLRIGAWFLRDFDYEELWREGRAKGINIIMTDHPMDVIRLGI